jgi:saccharopine dehydrogenase-like NADP-dependent oxidoreductase
VAGRHVEAAERFCAGLPGKRVQPLALDHRAPDCAQRLTALGTNAVIDAAGPFQERDHALARACAERGIHYVDLADSRRHVCTIAELDSLARSQAVLTVSGASTVPAISTAAVDELARGLTKVDSIDVGISPGHRAPRGLATVQAILSYCGRRIPALVAGASTTEVGWGDLHRHSYPAPVGSRWLSSVDVPERDIWPKRYPGLQGIRFAAGLELGVLHLALSAAARLVRHGLMRSLVPHARFMIRVADAFDPAASDAGAMHVRVRGRRQDGALTQRTWTLIAEHGDGPQIPATPAALLLKKLLGVAGYAPLDARGARPCVGLLSLEEIVSELAPLAISTQLLEE